MTVAHSPRYIPYDEFLVAEKQTDVRHEWVDGVVYAMSRVAGEGQSITIHGREGVVSAIYS